MFKTKKFWYILLFSILYLVVAGSSFFHAIAFFGLANNLMMSVILAFAFEVGQAAVLFSLLTSAKDRSRIMPWVLMSMFTLVQVIGNIYSSYKYIMLNSVENLRYFKEPIFIWTQLPDDQATVIITYVVGAILPIASLFLTSMITNYLSDQEELKNEQKEDIDNPETESLNEQQEIDNLNVALDKKDEEILKIKQELEELKNLKEINNDTEKEDVQLQLSNTEENKNDDTSQVERHVETETITPEDTKLEDAEISSESDQQSDEQVQEQQLEENTQKRESHFINL